MPDRYIRDALLGSPRWQSLPDPETQLFFIRLILLVDDFGVYDGRPEVIATHAFPGVLINGEEFEDVMRMLNALHRAEMIVKFSNNGKPYIAVLQWGNDLRGSRRYPAPPLDVDLEGVNVRGKFGKAVGWMNPPGCAPTSILLDINGHAVVPQPHDWRPAEHLRPNPKTKVVGWKRPAANAGSTDPEPPVQAASTSGLPRLQEVRLQTPEERLQTTESEKTENPPIAACNADATDDIVWENGFKGLSERQRLAWQEMFDNLSIPDQVARAEAWLHGNPEERRAYDRGERGGYHGFLIRWLLREVRAPAKSHST